ncbi:MAG: hypothetical protein II943_10550 [Victivallales bacterium]|nr:hypothetical protein [Victivallales bacterium]
MKFIREGKAYQLVIENGHDLKDALTLDEALWVAMSAPVKAFVCDQKFLAYVDTNKTGHISSEELKAAIRWLLDVYPKKDQITAKFSGQLQLADLNIESETGKAIDHSARYILKDLEAKNQEAIDLATVRKFQDILTARPLNGDGVISLLATTETKDAAKAEDMKSLVADAVLATGGTLDLDGTQGATLEQVKTFYDAIPQYLEWLAAGALPEGATTSEIQPFGGDTGAMLALLDANRALVDEFFKLCDLQGFDHRLTGMTLQGDGAPTSIDPTQWPGVESHLKAMPLVQPAGKDEIPLDNLDYINPLYRDWWRDLLNKIIKPVLGADTQALTPAGWAKVQAVFGPYKDYMASQKGGFCAAVDVEHLRKYAADAELIPLAEDLATRDAAVAAILKEAGAVEQALLYLQHLVSLCNNFISFPDLYEPKQLTLFERGKCVIDGRWFNMCFPVNDLGAHSALAANSSMFLIYVEVEAKPPYTVCAPVTIGDKGNLTVGKRGIFFDRDGVEFTCHITKVIENPVCLKEALLAPFSKFGKMAEDKVSSMASNSDATITKNMSETLNDPKAAAAATAAQAPAPKDGGGNKAMMFAGVGMAFAALSSAFAFICKTLSSMSTVAILVSLLAVILILLTPIALLAILKLRRQDLSSLLEGNGWAINSRLRLTRKQRKSFSRGGRFPKDAEGTPYKRFLHFIAWLVFILVVVIGGTFAFFWYKDYAAEKAAETAMQEYEARPHRMNPNAITEAPAGKQEGVPAEEAPAGEQGGTTAEEAPAGEQEGVPAEEAPAEPSGN